MKANRESMLAQNARRILNLALATENGLEVLVEAVGDIPSPTLRAKQVLYRFKKENADYDCLRIFQSPTDDSCLWVTKQAIGADSDAENQ